MNIKKFFCPHIVEVEGKFAIRKFTLLGWAFLDVEDRFWWRSGAKYCLFDSIKDCQERYRKYKNISFL